jgi:molybdopterin converting factor small subunit
MTTASSIKGQPAAANKLPTFSRTVIIIYRADNFQECRRRSPMQVAVELFGIARARAGVAQTSAVGDNLGDVLADLARRFPPLAESCIDGRTLRPGFIVHLGTERFVTAPDTPLCQGDSILLLSLDAGG